MNDDLGLLRNSMSKDGLFLLAMAMVMTRQGHRTISWTEPQLTGALEVKFQCVQHVNRHGETVWKMELLPKDEEPILL